MIRKDAKKLAEMMFELAAFHGDKSPTKAEHFIKYCLGAKKLGTAWVAFVGSEYAGFAVTYEWMNFVRANPGRALDLLYVRDEYRGRRVGHAIVSAIAEDALKKGITRINTSAVKTNKKAKAFYEKVGFDTRSNNSHRYVIEGDKLKRIAKKWKR